MNLKALRDLRAQTIAEGEALVQLWADDSREPTAEEMDTIRGLKAKQESIDADIAKAEELAEIARTFQRDPDSPQITGGAPRVEQDPMRGFNNTGEFALAVWRASSPNRANYSMDDRLKFLGAPTSPANSGTGSEGGYLIPPGISSRIYAHSLEGESLLAMTDQTPISGNTMAFPRDETTPWGSNGVRAYWEAEAAQATQTRPVTQMTEMRLHKLFALVPVTDELLSDGAAIGAYIDAKTGISIRWKTNDAIVNGSGAGQPLGFSNSGALVSQAKETSPAQVADTIIAENVVKMFARCLRPMSAVWMVNPDAFPQLPLMTIGDQPMFTPPNGLSGSPLGALMGRPIMMSEHCQTVGDEGDIYLADLSSYNTITKAGGIDTATSIHLWFDYGVSAFRATFRVDGTPWLASAVTPPNSSVTRSPFVTLAARA